jgi:hypothetical protein
MEGWRGREKKRKREGEKVDRKMGREEKKRRPTEASSHSLSLTEAGFAVAELWSGAGRARSATRAVPARRQIVGAGRLRVTGEPSAGVDVGVTQGPHVSGVAGAEEGRAIVCACPERAWVWGAVVCGCSRDQQERRHEQRGQPHCGSSAHPQPGPQLMTCADFHRWQFVPSSGSTVGEFPLKTERGCRESFR